MSLGGSASASKNNVSEQEDAGAENDAGAPSTEVAEIV